MRPRIYIAGPLTQDGKATLDQQEDNVGRAMTATVLLIGQGWAPFCPHLSFYLARHCEDIRRNVTWREWMECDDAFLSSCDALLYIGSSKGADIERRRALKRYGIPVFDKVTDVPDAMDFYREEHIQRETVEVFCPASPFDYYNGK